jgi:hypothetical protein
MIIHDADGGEAGDIRNIKPIRGGFFKKAVFSE